ncbi:MAG: response regulator [Lachnospiraceae bacterium]|nr:response regulator [Lachnospiraceae bacterium]
MYKVVVIEDETLTRRGLILTIPWDEHRCEVIGEAGDGKEGIELSEALQPDIIITDINMPGIDGLTMIEHLKDSTSAEFIIFSGHSDFGYAKQAIKLGVHGYLLKPVDDDEFLEVLDETVETIEKSRQYDRMLRDLDCLDQSDVRKLFAVGENSGTGKDKHVDSVIEYIKNHYAEDVTVRSASESLNMSESYLAKVFHSKTGYTFLEYLTMYRIEKAIELLSEGDMRTYEVANTVGYQDTKYFSKLFRKFTGMTPSEYRKGAQ